VRNLADTISDIEDFVCYSVNRKFPGIWMTLPHTPMVTYRWFVQWGIEGDLEYYHD
jgi:hypothetical protein